MSVPQPDESRLTPFAGHPIVVGVTPDQPPLVAVTACAWAGALGVPLFFAYSDRERVVVSESPDGSVTHVDVDPDRADDDWRATERRLLDSLTQIVPDDLRWQFRYLAGRPDRALTHLARAVDAAAFVVGTSSPGWSGRLRSALEGSVAAQLGHHQHRPVLVVPLSVVDWSQRIG